MDYETLFPDGKDDFFQPKGLPDRKMIPPYIKDQPGFYELNKFQAWGARTAAHALDLAVIHGYLDPNTLRKVADFGAGIGGPTFALNNLARVSSARVTAFESNVDYAETLVKSGILPIDQVSVGDGLAHLSDQKGQYDLVTAFMLGPDDDGSLFHQLAHSCGQGLTTTGKLLVTSEIGTMSQVQKMCDHARVPYDHIVGISLSEDEVVPDTLVIPQSSCAVIGDASQRSAHYSNEGERDFPNWRTSLSKANSSDLVFPDLTSFLTPEINQKINIKFPTKPFTK